VLEMFPFDSKTTPHLNKEGAGNVFL